jgi:hypothetical protein
VTDPESGKSVVGEETAAKQIVGVAFIQIRLAFFRAARQERNRNPADYVPLGR